MIQEYIKCFLLIFVAEMGDKTQILALTFATKYKINKVLIGVFLGSLLNHGIAVVLGSSLSKIIDFKIMGIFAGCLFVLFAFWSLRVDNDKEDNINYKYGAIITVAIAFFVGELGDKTQLTAITLASDSIYPIIVLAGTVSGMVLTSLIGIFVGMKLGKNIPETIIKIISAFIFMIFGLSKLLTTIPKLYLNNINVSIMLIIIFSTMIYRIGKLITIEKSKITKLQLESEHVKTFYQSIQNKIENICLGKEICGKCEGKSCIIGYIKYLINNEINNPETLTVEGIEIFEIKNKAYNIDMVIESLIYVIDYLKTDGNNAVVNAIRKNLEIILFNCSIEEFLNIDKYLLDIKSINSDKSDVLLDKLKEQNGN